MQLRKVCNRPFLLPGTTDVIERQMTYRLNKPGISDEVRNRVFVDSSGKLILVDKLLSELTEGSHKVVIFSQMVKVFDLLEAKFSSPSNSSKIRRCWSSA
jgi:SNF2 family DNA or RNA helicase